MESGKAKSMNKVSVAHNEKISCSYFAMLKVCKDQELKQSEPKSSPHNQNGKITKITNSQNTKITYKITE